MQFLLVTIVLESSLTELESSAIAFLVTIKLESSTIQFLVTMPIRELSNSVLTSKNVITELSNSILTSKKSSYRAPQLHSY